MIANRFTSFLRQGVEFIGKHPFATGLLAILGIVGFLVSVVGFRLDRHESIETTAQLTEVEDQLDSIAGDVAHPWEDRPNFSGSWDEATAFTLVWPGGRYIPNSYPEAEGGVIESEVPTLERAFFMPMRSFDARILVTGLSEGSCNACAVQLSLFVFRKEGDIWFLHQEARNFIRVGSRGLIKFGDGMANLEVWEIGSNRFGFVVPTSSWHQGETLEGYIIYSFIADEIVRVFDGVTRAYFSALEEPEARDAGLWYEMKILLDFNSQESNFGFYEMVGTFSNSEWSESTEIIFPFSGNNYPSVFVISASDCLETLNRPASIDWESCET